MGRPVLRSAAAPAPTCRLARRGSAAAASAGADPRSTAGWRRRPACGRFAKDVCAAYLDVATTGQASAATIDLLRRSSPAPILDQIKAPTLLIQGQADSLFPLSEAEANYRGIAATGTPVRVDWFTGGHDGGSGPQSDQDRLRFLTITWLDHYLQGQGRRSPSTGFTYSRVVRLRRRRPGGITTSGFSARRLPRRQRPAGTATVDVAGPPQRIANPPDGNPAAITSLPGTGGSFASLLQRGLARDPRPARRLHLRAAARPMWTWSARRRSSIRAASPTGEAVLFVKLYDVDPQSGASLPFGLAAPVRLTGLPATIDDGHAGHGHAAGASCYRFEAGHRLRITVATSDQAFTDPGRRRPSTRWRCGDRRHGDAAAAGRRRRSPTRTSSGGTCWPRWSRWSRSGSSPRWSSPGCAGAGARRRGRSPSYADTPLVVRGLRKEYADGFVAVSTVDFTVQRGQVVGLLGPNGAGKTTSLRVLLGMTQADQGRDPRLRPPAAARAPRCWPGSARWSRGRASCRTCPAWRTSAVLAQRPAGPRPTPTSTRRWRSPGWATPIHRKVRKYSHGMKQRLAIAQAMLGLPELLVLDEPTDGLDPPQIAEMRRVLRAYATDGRAVLVSSPPAGRGGADLHPRGGHAQGRGGRRRPGRRRGRRLADRPLRGVRRGRPPRAVLDGLARRPVGDPGRQRRWWSTSTAPPRTDVVAALVNAGRRGRPGGPPAAPRGRVPHPGRRRHEGERRSDEHDDLSHGPDRSRVATEIRRQASRPRTRIALAFMVVLPLIILVAFEFGGGGEDDNNGGGRVLQPGRPGHLRRGQLRAVHAAGQLDVPAGGGVRAVLRRHRGQRGELGQPALPAGDPGPAGPAARREARSCRSLLRRAGDGAARRHRAAGRNPALRLASAALDHRRPARTGRGVGPAGRRDSATSD